MNPAGAAWRVETIHEDDAVVAVVKPAGLPTANTPRGKESLYTLLSDRLGPQAFVGIVSRLDAPVSGIVVVAKTPAAAAGLAEQFRERTVEKRYLAVVAGRFPAPLGAWVEWHDQIRRAEGDRCSAIVPPAGKGLPGPAASTASRTPEGQGGGGPRRNHGPAAGRSGPESAAQGAHTRARVLARAGEVSLVELEPVTGRRHQLRVQLASRGCPIVGDRAYGSRLPFSEPGGIALHAARLALSHPMDGRPLALVAPAPAAWRTAFPSLPIGR
jgi:23S rRNA pseudouridine1911/1915/1917 synthase